MRWWSWRLAHSPWISRFLKNLWHRLLVANPRKVRAIYQNERKCDKRDAEMRRDRKIRFGRRFLFSFGQASFCFTPPMPFRRPAFLMMLLLALSSAVFASGKKDDKASVSFHMETENTENPKMIFPQLANGQTRYFHRTPEVNLKDIESFTPFPSEMGGDDYGIVFKLKNNAGNRLAAITNANQGRWMITQLNGRVVDGVLIDQQIDDGQLVIWKGVTIADIDALDKALPRTGQDGKKKKK